jgi:hypothetical protein
VSFPTIVATNHSVQNALGTATHVVALPNGCNVVGRRVVVFLALDDQSTVTWPDANWIEMGLFSEGASGNGRMLCAYRDISGGDAFPATGATINVVTPANDQSSHATFLIAAGSFDATLPPENAVASLPSTGTTIDPPSLTPLGGVKDYLWLTAGAADGNVTISGFPVNYTNTVSDACGTTGGTAIGAGARALNAASEDPNSFTISAAEQRSAQTVSIAPVPSGGDGTGPVRKVPILVRTRAVQRASRW